jgi:hypothetical protein
MDGSIDEIGHVIGCLDRERMLGEPRPRRDVIRHLPRRLVLPIGAFRQHSNHHVLKRDDAYAELNKFGVGQVGNVRVRFVRSRKRAAFIVPPRQRTLAKSGWA